MLNKAATNREIRDPIRWMVSRSAICLLALGATIAGGCGGPPRIIRNPPVTVERPPLPEGVKRLDRQTAPLPDKPAVHFRKLFSLPGKVAGRAYYWLAFAPNATKLAAVHTGADPQEIALFDLENAKQLFKLKCPEEAPEVRVNAFLSLGDRLVSGAFDAERVLLWDAKKGELLRSATLGKSSRGVMDLAAFPDGRRVLCCAGSGLYIWGVDLGDVQRLPLEDHVVRKPGNPQRRPTATGWPWLATGRVLPRR